MAALVYVLCAATAMLCAALLFRGYRRTGARLLLWSCLCFIGLSLDNSILWLDMIIFPDIHLEIFRNLAALLGLCLLIYGLIWDTK